MQKQNIDQTENSSLVKKVRRSKSVALTLTLATAMYFNPACSKNSEESKVPEETENSWEYKGPTTQPANQAELNEQQRVYTSNPSMWWMMYGNRGYPIPGHPYYPGNPLYDSARAPSGSSGIVHDSHSGKSSSSSTKSIPRGGFGSSGKSSSSS